MGIAGGWMTEKYEVPAKVGIEMKDFEGIHPLLNKTSHFLGNERFCGMAAEVRDITFSAKNNCANCHRQNRPY